MTEEPSSRPPRRQRHARGPVGTGTHPMISWLAALGVADPVAPPEADPRPRGAEAGQPRTAEFDALPPSAWAVVDDVAVDAARRLDHLVVGPPGVFAVTTRRTAEDVVVDGRHVFVGGIATTWLRDTTALTDRVGTALRRATGRDPRAWPVLVLDGCRVRVDERPPAATVLTSAEVPAWFLSQARTTHLSPSDVLAFDTAARAAATWSWTPGQVPTSGPADARRPPAVTVTHWPRFGQDRWYVTLADGTTLGHLDGATGTLHVDRPEDESLVRAVLRTYDAPLD